jgi:prolyl oligopeptidase
MKKIAFLMISVTLLAACKPIGKKESFMYPETKKVDTLDVYFGTEVSDPYRWLEDDMSEETKAWVVEQNKVTNTYLAQIPFREKIAQRLTTLWNFEKFTAPVKKADKYFFTKNDGLQNQSVLYYQKNLEDSAIVLIDPNKLSEEGTTALSGSSVSEDGKFIAYSIAKGGSDWNEIFVKDIESGADLADHLKWVKFSGMAWYKDGFFYGRYEEPQGSALSAKNTSQKIYYHKVNTPQSQDELIFEDKEGKQRFYSPQVTTDGKYLVIYESESTSGNNLLIKDLTNSNAQFVTLGNGFKSDFSVIDHKDGKFYILTNYEAPKYKLVSLAAEKNNLSDFKTVLAEKDDVLAGLEIVQGKIIAAYMHHAQSKLEMFAIDGNFLKTIELPGIGSVSQLSVNETDNYIFYAFTSFIRPQTIFKYSLVDGKTDIYKQPKLDFNPDDYETQQVFYNSKDGTKVPMFITMKKGTQLNGNNPTLLYSYGGFNISLTPSFSLSRLIWLENGYIYAQPNIRGGGEYGEEWHKAGTLLQKQNVFDDFIAAAQYLISNKYTNSTRITIHGGSNGGLLVGAVTNQRPDLFAVAIPAVGVMDMLRYHKFTIGWAWASDYGTSEDSTNFNNLYKYSPVHTVREKIQYPAVLVTTGDHDDRVVPAHSFKYIAELQSKYKGNNPVMIRIETMAGHGAGKPTEKQIQEIADMWAFAFQNMNVVPKY